MSVPNRKLEFQTTMRQEKSALRRSTLGLSTPTPGDPLEHSLHPARLRSTVMHFTSVLLLLLLIVDGTYFIDRRLYTPIPVLSPLIQLHG